MRRWTFLLTVVFILGSAGGCADVTRFVKDVRDDRRHDAIDKAVRSEPGPSTPGEGAGASAEAKLRKLYSREP
jgi:hypothetical protein